MFAGRCCIVFASVGLFIVFHFTSFSSYCFFLLPSLSHQLLQKASQIEESQALARQRASSSAASHIGFTDVTSASTSVTAAGGGGVVAVADASSHHPMMAGLGLDMNVSDGFSFLEEADEEQWFSDQSAVVTLIATKGEMGSIRSVNDTGLVWCQSASFVVSLCNQPTVRDWEVLCLLLFRLIGFWFLFGFPLSLRSKLFLASPIALSSILFVFLLFSLHSLVPPCSLSFIWISSFTTHVTQFPRSFPSTISFYLLFTNVHSIFHSNSECVSTTTCVWTFTSSRSDLRNNQWNECSSSSVSDERCERDC